MLRRDPLRLGVAFDEKLIGRESWTRDRRPDNFRGGLRNEEMSGTNARVAEFLELAERKLASREAAISPDGLEERFTCFPICATTLALLRQISALAC